MKTLLHDLQFTWVTAPMALGFGIAALFVAWAMFHGWNPYELTPLLQRGQAGLSCLGGLVFVALGVYGIVRLARDNSATNGH